MDDQNQNIKPDYSFITDQQLPSRPKKSKVKALLAGSVMILMVITIGAVLWQRFGAISPQKSATQIAEQTVADYYKNLATQNYEAAYSLTSSTKISKELYVKNVGPVFTQNFNLGQCKVQDTIVKQNLYYTTVKCPYKTGTAQEVFAVLSSVDTTKSVGKIITISNPSRDKQT